MKLRIFTEPQQGATYNDLLAVAKAAERLGFDAFFRSDHYRRIGEGDPGPGSTDAWITLAGLARETSTIRLGTLVSPATFRLPGPLAISVAQVDQMSGGRVELGIGAGWFDAEHTAYGIPFPPSGERFGRFEEQVEIVKGLWTAEKSFSYDGRYYRLVDSPALPKPAQRPNPPIIIGGVGAKRTPRLAAAFADEYNVPFRTLDATGEAFGRVRQAVQETGRTVTLSAAQTVCVGRDQAELERRAAAIGTDLAELRENGLAGSPAEVLEKIGRIAELGAERVYLQVMDLADLDHLELIAAEVLPHV
ncbi:LLM class F420-dependent oxidoreductase [Nonomuraea glycinis]|uniref:LLM class F420-dependent oxidoreductase n=1 Tax=Nonomuraea glycinis TaxID=2047744 RepID=A0A918E5S5_9ACTN|nr:LLM class F420-dependent oxidoreductase [Nonomuraea glycinis]MCA2179457.1 LLM class F420-dependent oxidoreductase [Nonomuraea glycinis]GGP09683.1 LLM class F420-dependent oxidoreductase [Nonomuraea glycinis]